jgi:hypothetical protein
VMELAQGYLATIEAYAECASLVREHREWHLRGLKDVRP